MGERGREGGEREKKQVAAGERGANKGVSSYDWLPVWPEAELKLLQI